MLGRGRIRTIVGTDPAAGVDVIQTVPAGTIWLLHSIRFTLTTDANAANREVSIFLDDSAQVFFSVSNQFQQVASTVATYVFANVGIIGNTFGGSIMGPLLPDVLLMPGYRVRSVTTNIQAGDDFSAPILLIEEW